jgi:hypothetical protein
MDSGMQPQEFYNSGGAALAEPPPASGAPQGPLLGNESFWHESAPADVRESYSAGESIAGWKAWKRHLLRRRRPVPIARLWKGKDSLLAWGDVAPPHASRLAWLLQSLGRHSKGGASHDAAAANAHQWLEERAASDDRSPLAVAEPHPDGNGDSHSGNGKLPHSVRREGLETTSAIALEALAWLHMLAMRVNLFDRDSWWRVWRHLHEMSRRPAISLDADPLGHQLSAGELPLTLAYLFPELNPCHQLQSPAAAALSHGMAELLDGEGLPQSRHLAAFRPLAACWTRCRLLGENLEGGCWNAEAEEQFPLALREAVRLTRQDGSPTLTSAAAQAVATVELASIAAKAEKSVAHVASRSAAWLVDVAAELIADKPTRRLIRATLATRREKAALRVKPRQLPHSAVHSEWSEIAVLRPDWSARGERLIVAYGARSVRAELAVGADLFLNGRWELEIRADGDVAEPTGEWCEVCWVSDDDCDYLELEMELSGSLRVQRQMLLARKDQFLFLADAVLGDRPHELSYRGRLPLAPRLTASTAAETRELLLEGHKARALVLPLALPEWRADGRGGSLAIEGGALELRQAGSGRRLFAPLWFDLSQGRAEKAFTWRQLTVAEQRQNQPRDVAVGYRVQFANRQWLVYRSLAEPANRTLLGTNLSTDFYLARFRRDGETDAILEIE